MSKIRLHFEPNLEYQHHAIEAVCGLFEGSENGSQAFSVSLPVALQEGQQKLGLEVLVHKNSTTLSGNDLLRNLQAIQERNGIEMSTEVKPNDWHFTVEMETGTGKTYVYLRTIYELNKRYGFSKFVIVVPSIAIKEGVDKSISIMREHFRTLYDGVEMNSFTYDASRLQEVRNFGNSDKLQIMVCTIQSITDIRKEAEEGFQDTAKRKGGKRAKRVMYTANEKTDDRKPIEFIQECNPIVIIDEPQNIGTKGEEKGIACLHPLCTLRYSATHKNLFHPVYALNAVDAGAQKLVKGIEVACVQSDLTHVEPYIKLVSTSPKKGGSAKLEVLCKMSSGDYGIKTVEVQPGTLLEMLTDCPGVYENVVVQEVHEDYVVCSHLESPLFVGQSTGGIDEEQITRAMIRTTIEEHMKKEVRLRPKGIKVLSLFFIDQVADYRQYDELRQRRQGPLVQIFEQEYEKVMRMPQYRSLYEGNPPAAESVHDGYFSIDKGKKGQEDIWTNTEDNAEGKKAAQRAYALIMRDKERLLSLEEPLKFIFSHSALREGWDNPNVFQVCVLRDMGSKVSRRQALGRGLRLCVNQEGVRVRESGINTLTVVAREDFKTYAARLQKEYEEDGIRFGIITKARLGMLEYTDPEGKPARLGQELAGIVLDDLQGKGLITGEGKPTEELKKQLEAGTYKVPEACREARLEILGRLRQLTRQIEIKDARERQSVTVRYEKMVLDKDFLELWNRIKKKTTYRVQFDSEELIRNVIAALDIELVNIKAPLIHVDIIEVEMDSNGIQAGAKKISPPTVKDTTNLPVGDILTSLESATHLTRQTLSRILCGIQHLKAIRYNGPLFEKTVLRVIRAELKKLMVDGVSYKPVTIGEKEYNAQELFKDTEGYLDKMVKAGEKCVMDHVIWDSEVERDFAQAAEASEQVKMYVKLPSSFRIPTPLGPYNPDWALVVEIEGKNHLYFVVETKSEEILAEGTLRIDEANKIRCARKHFDLVGNGVDNAVSYLAPIKELSSVIARALKK